MKLFFKIRDYANKQWSGLLKKYVQGINGMCAGSAPKELLSILVTLLLIALTDLWLLFFLAITS